MIVKCTWMKNGVCCGKTGYLILEKPRKKKEVPNYLRREIGSKTFNRNTKHKEYEPSRERGCYYRVHHYVFDDSGRRKSKFCYLGNFDGALKKLKQIEKILGKYASSEKLHKPIYNNDWFGWDLDLLKHIHDRIITAKKLESFKDNPNRYAEIIFKTISAAQFYLIRGDKIFRMYA